MASSSDFSMNELARMQATLQRRFKAGHGSNIVAVGFGLPYRGGVLDKESGVVATFHVREKRPPTPDDTPIPPEITVRLKRGKAFVNVRLPTDVVPARTFRRTGRLTTYTDDRKDDFTSGAVVAWRVKGQDDFTFAIVTVRHAFERASGIAPLGSEVKIWFRTTGPRDEFVGRLLWRSRVGSNVDAAVVTVALEDLHTAQILSKGDGIDGIDPRPETRLRRDLGATGFSRRADSEPQFTVENVFPDSFGRLNDGLGPLSNVIIVVADDARAFEPTTSGSAWRIGPVGDPTPDAAIQVGATPESGYTVGAGQSLFLILDAVKQNVLQDASIARNSFVFLTTF